MGPNLEWCHRTRKLNGCSNDNGNSRIKTRPDVIDAAAVAVCLGHFESKQSGEVLYQVFIAAFSCSPAERLHTAGLHHDLQHRGCHFYYDKGQTDLCQP
ncbi:uncharacterized protein ccl20a.4 isoform X1 [Chanodichthys erythropterus]|uniref:uncharacterized protein ccl20a.4 isoform X1 n=1 Tax=Chanodichthys erythropterus TaxID=933992 RepID=UPI00351EBA96